MSIRQLQLIQNAAAWVLTETKKVDLITPVLRSLHQLSVRYRTNVLKLLLVYEVLNGLQPKYISDLQLCSMISMISKITWDRFALCPQSKTAPYI